MAVEIESFIRAWVRVSSLNGAAGLWTGDGVTEVARAGVGQYDITLDEAFDKPRTGFEVTPLYSPGGQNPLPVLGNINDPLTVSPMVVIQFVATADILTSADPEGFTLAVLVGNSESELANIT